jgi:hypothetical protein
MKQGRLLADIADTFMQVIMGELSIGDFEKWVYETKSLELTLSTEDYFELIALNYKQRKAKYVN